MKKTNKEMLISLIKVKKLHASELEKKLEGLKDEKALTSIYSSLISIINADLTILSQIVESEKKIG